MLSFTTVLYSCPSKSSTVAMNDSENSDDDTGDVAGVAIEHENRSKPGGVYCYFRIDAAIVAHANNNLMYVGVDIDREQEKK